MTRCASAVVARLQHRLAGVVSLLVLALLAAMLFRARIPLVSWEFDTTHPESALVQIGLWAEQTGRLYPALATPPYTPAPHGPAYYESLKFLAHGSHGQWRVLAVRARLLTLCAFFVCAALAGSIAWKLTGLSWTAAASALLVLIQPISVRWSVTARPDILALMFSLGALLAFCWSAEPRSDLTFFAGLMSGVGVLYKQSFVAAALAIGLVLLAGAKWRQIAWLVGGAFLPPILLFGKLLAQGEPVIQELLLMGNFATDFRSTAAIVIDALGFPAQLAVVALGGFGAWRLWRMPQPRSRVLALYAGISLILGGLTMLNVGASSNYLVEALAALAVTSAAALDGFAHGQGRLAPLKWVVAVLLIVSAAILAGRAFRDSTLTSPNAPLARLLQGKRVLSDQPYFAVQGSRPAVLDPFTTTQLEARGKWSSLPLREEIRGQEFDWVLLKLDAESPLQGNRFTPAPHRHYFFFSDAVFQAVRENYRLGCVVASAGARFLMLAPAARYQAAADSARRVSGCAVGEPAEVSFVLPKRR